MLTIPPVIWGKKQSKCPDQHHPEGSFTCLSLPEVERQHWRSELRPTSVH